MKMPAMTSPEAHFAHALWITFTGSVALAVTLSVLPRLGDAGRRVSDALAKAPLLDLVVGCFTIIPWLLGSILGGCPGFIGALMAQFATLGVWCAGHELIFRQRARGPSIVEFHSRIVGDWRNYLALSITLLGLPIFWGIRLLEICFGWALPVLLNFPAYKQGEWVNVSRHKFDGLIGHDLVWCLYCDWMTGVWSLGSEVLRNVESFWCPIRYYDGKKCDNCAIDFPDVNNGWVPIDRSMRDVIQVMEEKYGDGQRAWFGHPTRLTVKGQPIQSKGSNELSS